MLLSHCLSIDVIVLAKLPLGLFVPRFQDVVPDNFPYNPYVRDFMYVSVAMTCRGEFSFVIASFALQEGLFTQDLYSAVVFAVLLSAITSPFVLLSLIKYYNRKSEAFLELLQDQKAADGKMPLYLAIQARTPNQWGLQETIHSALKREGIIIIDHRSWHPRGLDAIVMTELYVEDPELRVPIQRMHQLSTSQLDVEGATDEAEMAEVMDTVDARCASVKKALEEIMGHADETRVVVTWWQPSSAKEHGEEKGVPQYEDLDDSFRGKLKTEAQSELTTHEEFNINLPQHRRRRRDRMVTPKLGQDMWSNDEVAQSAAMTESMIGPAAAQKPTVVAGRYRYGRRRKVQSDITGFIVMDAAPLPEERLAGFVRRDEQPSPVEFGMLHPGHSSEREVTATRARRSKTKSDLTGLFDRKSRRMKTNSDITGFGVGGGGVDLMNGAIPEDDKEDDEREDEGKQDEENENKNDSTEE